jgi:hypothetical protein
MSTLKKLIAGSALAIALAAGSVSSASAAYVYYTQGYCGHKIFVHNNGYKQVIGFKPCYGPGYGYPHGYFGFKFKGGFFGFYF